MTEDRSWKISHIVSLIVIGTAVVFGAVSAASSTDERLMTSTSSPATAG
jgi:hypothetical protein